MIYAIILFCQIDFDNFFIKDSLIKSLTFRKVVVSMIKSQSYLFLKAIFPNVNSNNWLRGDYENKFSLKTQKNILLQHFSVT